eukprot:TRINITY_DN12085_c5_g1_i1.p1 TRINITY_DN12085_c5_g1~~TRINITY_DN12085_c5_g1_i1.p1  ORF type:complete len:597 (+),score=130.76 TRINITY_DN12085_c5_g1_i1:1-1791(+)
MAASHAGWLAALVCLSMAASAEGACPINSTEAGNGHCICDSGLVCRVTSSSKSEIRSGSRYECSKAISYHTLHAQSGFHAACTSCVCEPETPVLTTSIAASRIKELEWLPSAWHVGVMPPMPADLQTTVKTFPLHPHADHIQWLRRSKGYLPPAKLENAITNFTLDSPWSALCDERFRDANYTVQHPRHFRQYNNDGRISAWVHHTLLEHEQAGKYIVSLLDAATIRYMSGDGRYIMSIYIYDVKEDGPVIVLHPQQFLKRICSTFNIGIKGHLSGVAMSMEHVMRLLPRVLAHAHFKHLDSFLKTYQGEPVQQVSRPAADTYLRHCSTPWPHSPSANFIMPEPLSGTDAKNTSVAVMIPSYDGHWPYFSSLIDAIYNETQQPDQIVIATSETNIQQAKEVLYSLPDPFGHDRVSVVAKLSPDNAAGNRNTGMTMVRMKIAATMDGDDIPHPQRLEFVRWLYREKGSFSLFAHAGMRSRLPLKPIECLTSWRQIKSNLHDATQVTTEGGQHAIKLPIRIKGRSFGYAQHGHVAFESKFYPINYWEGGSGQDQGFDKRLLELAQQGNHSASYFLTQPLLFYLNYRSAHYDKNKLQPI